MTRDVRGEAIQVDFPLRAKSVDINITKSKHDTNFIVALPVSVPVVFNSETVIQQKTTVALLAITVKHLIASSEANERCDRESILVILKLPPASHTHTHTHTHTSA